MKLIMVSFLCFKKVWILCILWVLLFSCQIGGSLAAEKDLPKSEEFSVIDFKNGRLKVSVRKQDFKKVMDEISKKAEMKILIKYPVEEKLTIGFDYLPLEKGLEKLLRRKNYAFYRSLEDQQPARLMCVIFSEAEETTVAMNFDQQQRLGESLRSFNQNREDLRKQFDEAMEVANVLDNEEIIKMVKDETGRDFPLDIDGRSQMDFARRYRLGEVMRQFNQNKKHLSKQIGEAMETMNVLDNEEIMKMIKDETGQGFPLDVDRPNLAEMISSALQGI